MWNIEVRQLAKYNEKEPSSMITGQSSNQITVEGLQHVVWLITCSKQFKESMTCSENHYHFVRALGLNVDSCGNSLEGQAITRALDMREVWELKS